MTFFQLEKKLQFEGENVSYSYLLHEFYQEIQEDDAYALDSSQASLQKDKDLGEDTDNDTYDVVVFAEASLVEVGTYKDYSMEGIDSNLDCRKGLLHSSDLFKNGNSNLFYVNFLVLIYFFISSQNVHFTFLQHIHLTDDGVSICVHFYDFSFSFSEDHSTKKDFALF